MDLVYEVRGCVNNVPIEIAGRGSVDGTRVVVEQNVEAVVFHWDAALGALGVAEIMLSVAVAGPPEPDLPEPVRSWTMLHDENGREVGRAVASGILETDSALRLQLQFVEAAFRMEIGEKVVGLTDAFLASLLVDGPRRVLTAAWAVETDCGNVYRGVTTAVRETLSEGSAGSGIVRVEDAGLERAGSRLSILLKTMSSGTTPDRGPHVG